jgi:phage tail sheath gpL-like
MSTRAQVRFATREDGVSFSEHPEKIHAQFYVHQDGYPEGLGMDIAEMISKNNNPSLNWEIEHVQDIHTDLDYIYYIWSDYDKDTWISIFQRDVFQDICQKELLRGGELSEYTVESIQPSTCIFVGKPEKLIEKYKLNTNEDG